MSWLSNIFKKTKSVCRHTAPLAYRVMKEKYPVRIVIGKTPSGKEHMQAQAQIDGEWKWLVCWPWPEVIVEDRPEHEIRRRRSALVT